MAAPTFLQALEAAELAARHALPQVLHERISCAVALVKEGRVFQTDDPHLWTVDSASTLGKTYSVNGACDCEDYQFRAPQKLCKHRLAVLLSRKALKLMQEPSAAAHSSSEEPDAAAAAPPICSTPTAAPAAPSAAAVPLPEAPASLNFRAMIGGYETQITLRDASEERLLARLQALLKHPALRPVPKPAPRPWQGRKGGRP